MQAVPEKCLENRLIDKKSQYLVLTKQRGAYLQLDLLNNKKSDLA